MRVMVSRLVVPFALFALAAGDVAWPNSTFAGQAPPDKAEKSPDERAIEALSAAFVKAFNAGDANAIAAFFTDDAEATDEDGTVTRGKAEIARSFAETFAASPGGKMQLRVDSLRLLSPDAAQEDGRCTITPAAGGAPDVDRYTVVYVKKDGRWLQSSVREHADPQISAHDRLEELAWMLGDWVDESHAAVISTNCRWSDDGNFLLRRYSIQIHGKPAMTGEQRIGWDPVLGQFKSWIFDSRGGHSEGVWSRDGRRWLVRLSGPLQNGKISTETNIITRVNKDMARWRSVDRSVGGELLPDSPEFVLVRKPPPVR